MSEVSSPTVERAVVTEQIRILYANLPLTILGTTMVSIALAFVLAQTFALWPLVVWLSLHFVMWTWRLYEYLEFRRTELTPTRAAQYRRRTIIYSFLYGLLWAWPPLFYFTPDPMVLSNIGLFVVGTVAGALVSQAVFLPSLYAFMLPISVSSTLALILFAGEFVYLSVISVAYCGIAVVFAQRVNGMFVSVIETRFENDDLLTALRREKDAAEQANLAKSQFLAAASHDVRQPLHALGLYIGMLKEDPGNADVVERAAGTLDTLEDLYAKVLDISRLDAGAVEVDRVPVDLIDLCRQAVVSNASVAEAKHISLVLEAGDGPLWVRSDPALLRRIVDNLVANALRYTHAGGVRVQVEEVDGRIRLSVVDTGIGIREADFNRIFDEYFQLDNEQRDQRKGLGLGLSIVRRLCDLLAHEITVRSEEGAGSTFTLHLGRRSAAPAPIESTATPIPTSGYSSDLVGMQVIVVEDNHEVLDALILQLDEWGSEIQSYETGAQALAEATAADFVISDYRLPGGVNGRRVVEELVASKRALAGVVLTGDTHVETLSELTSSGVAYLHKPVASAELKALLSQHRLKEGLRA